MEEVADGLSRLPHSRVSCLHVDLSDEERDAILAEYRATDRRMEQASPRSGSPPGQEGESGYYSPRGAWHAIDPEEAAARRAKEAEAEAQTRHLLVATDAALKSLGGRSLGVRLLVHYDLPGRREVYTRRALALATKPASCCASVHFAVAGLLEELRMVEGFAAARLEEMPLQPAEIFAAPSP